MRAPLVLLLAVPLATAASGETVERPGWTQFLPDWQVGPAEATYQDAMVTIPADVSYATDGASWFYASNDTPERLSAAPPCGPGDAGTYVVLTSRACMLVPHPGFACSGTTVCGPGHAAPVTPTYPLDTCGVPHAACTPAPAVALLLPLFCIVAILRART